MAANLPELYKNYTGLVGDSRERQIDILYRVLMPCTGKLNVRERERHTQRFIYSIINEIHKSFFLQKTTCF